MRLVVLLALTTLFGVAAVVSTPTAGTAIGIWPVVLATATFFLTTRPPWPVITVLIGAIGILTVQVDRPTGVAVGLGLGLAAEATLTWWVLSGGRRGERPTLHDTRDLARLLAAVCAGASVMAVATALTSLVTGWGDAAALAVATATAGLASQLVLLPLIAQVRRPRPRSRPVSRVLQWLLVLGFTPALFVYHSASVTLILILPVLIWSALRSHVYDTFGQLLAVGGIAIVLTTVGVGPLSGPRFGDFGPDSQGVLLAIFIGACALVVLTLVVSVAEQDEQQRQLAAERDRVERIVGGTSGIAIIGTDLDANITLFNPGAERLYGYRAEEVLGRPTSVLSSHLTVVQRARELDREQRHGDYRRSLVESGPTVVRIRRRDGVIRHHLLVISPVRDDRGEEIGYVTTAEDITERVETEERLRDALEAERSAVERLREVDLAKDTFVSNVSHELRTPITSILGYTEMLEEGGFGELTPEQCDAVRRIGRNSSRLLSLIGDLLTLSRIQETGPELAHRALDLREVVESGMTVVRAAHERRDLEVHADLPAEPVAGRGDREQLERVVINLLSNAVKFTPDGGRVAIRLSTRDATAVLEVADTGIGIPADEQEHLFERFFRSSLSQHHEIPGTGLGLPITHTIVERHGGTIAIESAVGSGTTMRVTLPLPAPDRPRNETVRVSP